jgi:two-component system response regulator MtrA
MLSRILLVEDDERLGQQIVDRLRAASLEPSWVKDGADALAANPAEYALVVLDLMLPGAHGLDILKRFRETADTPVLVLSARNETTTKVRALELGADDYVTKPFWPEELIARVSARLRRPGLERGGAIELAGLAIDVPGRSVSADGVPVELTRVEFDLLLALARRPGQAFSRAWICEHVLDPERDGSERTLDVHVSRLRKKLGSLGEKIVTVWGVGYRFVE